MDSSAPHLCCGRSLFVPRLGRNQGKLLPLLAEEGASLVAAPLASAPRSTLPLPGIALPALALDPDTPRLELGERERGSEFLRLDYGDLPRIEPDDERRADDATRFAYAQTVLNEQRGHGGSLLLAPYHHARATGPGRNCELLLVRTAAQLFKVEGMSEPTYSGQPPRQLFAPLMVDVAELREARTFTSLLESYVELSVDGYWVQLRGFHETAALEDVRKGTLFLRMLQERSQRPVVACRPGNLALPLLSGGLAGASGGIGSAERVHPPAPAKRRDDTAGRQRNVYHPFFGASYCSHGRNVRNAFAAVPCKCGEHSPELPPEKGEIERHTARVRARAAQRFATGPIDERIARLRKSIKESTWIAHEFGLPQPKSAAMLTVLEQMAVELPPSPGEGEADTAQAAD